MITTYVLVWVLSGILAMALYFLAVSSEEGEVLVSDTPLAFLVGFCGVVGLIAAIIELLRVSGAVNKSIWGKKD